VVAAIVGGGAVVLWHQIRKRREGDPSVRSLRSVNLDVGETVIVTSWQGDGTAQVKYRGANWTAIHRPGVMPATGAHRVSELVGNRLLVDKIP
jgi:membrane protein implicated in regulation of membrane protease activity